MPFDSSGTDFTTFLRLLLKRAVTSWSGVDAFLSIVTSFAVLLIPITLSGLAADVVGQLFQTIVAIFAVVWVGLVFFFLTPYRMWVEERRSRLSIEDGLRSNDQANPKINVSWRERGKDAELILTNLSSKTIDGIEVLLRNHQDGDNPVQDDLKPLKSRDGKVGDIRINPGVPTYFRFATAIQSAGRHFVALTTADGISSAEVADVGVKIGVSGNNILGHTIRLRVKTSTGKDIAISKWSDPAVVVAQHGVDS